MDKTDRAKVEDLLRTILFGEEHNVCRIQPLEVLDMKVGEPINDRHDILFDDIPTTFEELRHEPIRPRGLVRGKVVDGSLNLVLSEAVIDAGKVMGLQIQGRLAKVEVTARRLGHGGSEVLVNHTLLLRMRGNPTIVVTQSVNEVFPAPPVHPNVKKISCWHRPL